MISVGKKNYAQSEIELAMIGVERSLQRRGIGSALLTHAIERAYDVAMAVGITSMWLDATNDDAAKLYAKYGFERLEPGKLKMWIPIAVIIDLIENT